MLVQNGEEFVRKNNDMAFHDKQRDFIKDQGWSCISISMRLVTGKAYYASVDYWWNEGDDSGQPTVCISTQDANDPRRRDSVLPALRKWLRSDEFVTQECEV